MADQDDETAAGEDEKAPDAPDLNALAREYLDLWQQQLAETARDDTLARTMSDAVRLMSAGAAQMASQTAAMQQVMARQMDQAGVAGGTFATDTAEAATGTAAAGASHRDDGRVLDELHRRVAELEERLAVLERSLPGKG